VAHTTGINWDAVLANVASISVVLGLSGAVVTKVIKRSIKDQVGDVVDTKVTPLLNRIQHRLDEHDTRIAHLEGVEAGKRYAYAAAGITTTERPEMKNPPAH
jgi:hypothetical protein